jgi:hypothetical protein
MKDFKPKALVLSKEWLIHENIDQKKISNLPQDYQLYVNLLTNLD